MGDELFHELMAAAREMVRAGRCPVPGCDWTGSPELLGLNQGVCPEHRQRELDATAHLEARHRAWYGDSLDELTDAWERERMRVERGLPGQPWDDDLPGGDQAAPAYDLGAVGTKYGLAALRRECDRVRAAKEGDRHRTLVSAAASIGNRIIEGHLDERHAAEQLEAAGMATGLRERHVRSTVADQFRFARERPRR
jgi:hypothetical protein